MKTSLSISVDQQTIKKILQIIKENEGMYRSISHFCEGAIAKKIRDEQHHKQKC